MGSHTSKPQTGEKHSVKRPAAASSRPKKESPTAGADLFPRVVTEARAAQPADILKLQRSHGNRAAQHLLTQHSIQTKLSVGPANDRYEQEADRVAGQVMRMAAAPSPTQSAVQLAPEQEDASKVQAKPLATSITALVQRSKDKDELGEVHTQSNDPGAGFEAGSVVEAQLRAQTGSGSPLPGEVRDYMEPRFGADFSGVRLHTDGQAADLNRQMSAQAFTHGQDIYLGEAKYAPGTDSGKRLLAHELTHVVQQTGAAESERVRRTPAAADEAAAPVAPVSKTSALAVQRLAYNDPPTGWGAVNLRRSDFGQNGVVEVTQGADKIVVKPSPTDSGNVEFANSITESMGFVAPQIATYPKMPANDGSQGGKLAGLLTAGPVPNERGPNEVANQVAGAHYFLVMDVVEGQGVPVLGDNDAIDFIQNASNLNQIGRLMVTDTFLGNTDRLENVKVNWGNFLYQGAQTLHRKVATIDNDAGFSAGHSVGTRAQAIDELIDNPLPRAQTFLHYFRVKFQAKPNVLAVVVNDFVTGNILTGIQDGLRDIAQLFATNKDLIRALGTLNERYGASAARNVNVAKGVGEYIGSRQGGENPATAAAQLTKYLDYRAKRDFLPTGLKWAARPLNLGRGF